MIKIEKSKRKRNKYLLEIPKKLGKKNEKTELEKKSRAVPSPHAVPHPAPPNPLPVTVAAAAASPNYIVSGIYIFQKNTVGNIPTVNIVKKALQCIKCGLFTRGFCPLLVGCP